MKYFFKRLFCIIPILMLLNGCGPKYTNEDLIGLWSYDYNSSFNQSSYEGNSYNLEYGEASYWNMKFMQDGTFEQNVGIPRTGKYFIKKVSSDYYIQLAYDDGENWEDNLYIEKTKGNRRLQIYIKAKGQTDNKNAIKVIFYN